MSAFDFITVPIIVSVVYGGITLLKKAVKCHEKLMRFLPLIAAGLGAVLGIVAFFAMPEIIPASNAFVAILVGGASGLAATGCNQAIKQLLKKPEELLNKFLPNAKKNEGDSNKDTEGKSDDGTKQ